MSELVSAVEFVHAIGFLHRDIKTSNVVIDRRGHLRLIDFGFAKQVIGDGAVCHAAEHAKPYAAL
jgi:serine/threonine protein kinase